MAGATFMAAGSSIPELFTSFIGMTIFISTHYFVIFVTLTEYLNLILCVLHADQYTFGTFQVCG